MITKFFKDLNKYLRIRIHQCCDCGKKLEFRVQKKSYYCRNCKKHFTIENDIEFNDIIEVTKNIKIDTYTGIVDIYAWRT